jgi:hypothetical protein
MASPVKSKEWGGEEEWAESGYGNMVHDFSLLQACTSDTVALYTRVGSHAVPFLWHWSAIEATDDFKFEF